MKPTPETVRQIIEFESSVLKVEVFALSDDPQDQSRFQRRIRKNPGGQYVSFPTAEDVIVWKLRWARPKDLDDVGNVILVKETAAQPTPSAGWTIRVR